MIGRRNLAGSTWIPLLAAVALMLASPSRAEDTDGNGFNDGCEQALVEKFCPSLVLHSGDQGVSPEPVEIMGPIWIYAYSFADGDYAGDQVTIWTEQNYSFLDSWNDLTNPAYTTEGLTNCNFVNGYFPFWHWDYAGPGPYPHCGEEVSGEYYDQPAGWYDAYHNGNEACAVTTNPPLCFTLQPGSYYPNTLYAHPFKQGGQYVIQYWFFYPFNDWVANHEGDWEHINVVITSDDPATAQISRVIYYFHHKYKVCETTQSENPAVFECYVTNGSHPVVFVGGYASVDYPDGAPPGVGNGSHGSYPVWGTWSNVATLPLGLFPATEYVDGAGNWIPWRSFIDGDPTDAHGVVLLKNPSYYNYTAHPEMSWLKAKIPWGFPFVHSSSTHSGWTVLLDVLQDFGLFKDANLGNVPPVSPPHQVTWNLVDTDAGEFTRYFGSASEFPIASDAQWTPPTTGGVPRLSGNVLDGATPVAGLGLVLVDDGADCPTQTTTTDASGHYEFEVNYLWSGKIKVMPTGNYNKLTPEEFSYGGVTADVPNPDVQATHTVSWSDWGETLGLPIDRRECGLALDTDPLFLRGTQTLAATTDGSNGAIVAWYGERFASDCSGTLGNNGAIYAQRINDAGELQWKAQGVYLGEAGGVENGQPLIVADGAGGAIVVWYTADPYIRVQRIDANGNILWPWGPYAIDDPVFVYEDPYADVYESIDATTDGDGGVIIAWVSALDLRILATRVTQYGTNGWSSWPDTGRNLETADRGYTIKLVSDDSGGAIVVWQTATTDPNPYRMFARHVESDGFNDLSWPSYAVPIDAASSYYMWYHRVCSDGNHGAIVSWDHWGDIHAQRLNAQGQRPWGTSGVVIFADANSQTHSQIVPDGIGGAIVAWEDYRNGSEADIFANHIQPNGQLDPAWTAGGRPVCTANGVQRDLRMAPSSNGVILSWADRRSGDFDIYAERLRLDGSADWSTGDGILIAGATGDQTRQKLVSDGSGGAIFTWRDKRGGEDDIYAMRRGWATLDVTLTPYAKRPDGTLAPMPDNNMFACPLGDAEEYVVEVHFDPAGISGVIPAAEITMGQAIGTNVRIFGMTDPIAADNDATAANNYTTTITHGNVAGCGEDQIPVFLGSQQIGLVAISAHSPDRTADGAVDIADFGLFGTDYQSPPKPYNPCSDYDSDGDVDLGDFGLFGLHWPHVAPDYVEPAAPAHLDQGPSLTLAVEPAEPHQGSAVPVVVTIDHVESMSALALALEVRVDDTSLRRWSPNPDLPEPVLVAYSNENRRVFLAYGGTQPLTGSSLELGRLELVGGFETAQTAAEYIELDGGEVLTADGRALRIWNSEILQLEPTKLQDYLDENRPNPFNPVTTIVYSLAAPRHVTISVYNVKGQLVSTLVNEHKPAGEFSVEWDGHDRSGQQVASGVYFYRMKTGRYVSTRKLVLLK